MKHCIHIVLFLFCPFLALSQYYLKGRIKDETGNILQNAKITLHSSSYNYYSGSEGTFGITTNKKTDTLTVSMDGYQRLSLPVDVSNFIEVKLKKSVSASNTRNNKLASLTQNLKRETQQQWFTGDETYASIIENQFINTTAYPATGLTLNVDRASYSNIRRFISMNTSVPPDAVRLEEMLNYFNFNYKEPPPNRTFQIKTILTDCPWNENNLLMLAHITSKKLNLDSLPPTHLVFLIDVSGSMDMPNRLPLLKSGFKALVNNLRPKDSVSIVVYGGIVGISLPTTGGGEKEKILRTIDSLQPGGSTPGASGIKLAYSVAKNHFIKGGNNRIILATDGDFNVGLKSEQELEEMISEQSASGIYLTCLGIGMGNYKDSKIQLLAQKGNGNFAYIDSYAEVDKVLLKEFSQTLYTVADDAYLNVEFDPDFVKEYRLLGFDNKVGALKDKEAIIEGGEIGSAYSTLVAFELVPTNKGLSYAGDQEMHQSVNFSLQYKLPGLSNTLILNEKPPLKYEIFEEIPKCYRFASAVLMFGAALRNSRFVKDINWNDIQKIAYDAVDRNNYSQMEFLTIVQNAENIYGKKKRKKGH
ncbi:MAG: YfbK domain-containing protein [Flavisolibacter sp.]